jgi:hypothetical protein
MAEQHIPERHTVEVGHSIEALMQVQAFVAGRLYGELVVAGLMTNEGAAERLRIMAVDIEAMNGPEPAILRGVALPMRGYAEEFDDVDRPRLHVVRVEEDSQ